MSLLPRPKQHLLVQQGSASLTQPFGLLHGGRISNGAVAYTLYGDLQQPTVLVLGGISASRDVGHFSNSYNSGWWQALIGPERAINTAKYSVLSIDYIGGNGASSGPDDAWGTPQGSVSSFDQAAAVVALLDALKIGQLYAAIGSSYGGMVTLALLQQHASRVARALIISAADKAHPQSSGLRYLQRQIVANCESQAGLELARALAMLTYRSREEFEQRFENNSLITDHGFSSDLINYLLNCGKKFAQHFSPDAFLRLSESIDLHRVDVSKIKVPFTCLSVTSDQLIPEATIKRMAERGKAHHISIQSIYGHDAFLKETEKLASVINPFLSS